MNSAEALAQRLNSDAQVAREQYISPEAMEEARLPKTSGSQDHQHGALELDARGEPRDKFSVEAIEEKQAELAQVLFARARQAEDVADELDQVIRSVFIGSGGILAFLTRAFSGTKVPREAGDLIDAINDKLELLEDLRDRLFEDLVESQELLNRAATAPDRHNRIVLKHRSFQACVRVYPKEKLELAEQRYQDKLRIFEELG